jgi:hypothetical protein
LDHFEHHLYEENAKSQSKGGEKDQKSKENNSETLNDVYHSGSSSFHHP